MIVLSFSWWLAFKKIWRVLNALIELHSLCEDVRMIPMTDNPNSGRDWRDVGWLS